MARNPIQFQKGLSLSAFQRAYGTEEQCRAAVIAWRWPEGFVCPNCGGRDHTIAGRRRLYLCHDCRRQTSARAGTIFEKSLLPFTTWFQAMWLLTQSKTSISTLEMARRLGVKWDSAWLMRQKLMTVMEDREKGRQLDGRVEVDDAVLGGEQAEDKGGKRGRGGSNKLPFVIAVATREGRPQAVLLKVIDRFCAAAIERLARTHFAPSATIVSDGLPALRAVRWAGCRHEVTVTAHIDKAHRLDRFRWANTLLGNIKTAIAGTLKAVRSHYAARYLVEFQYRFNRRADLAGIFLRLAAVAVRTPPRPYTAIVLAHVDG